LALLKINGTFDPVRFAKEPAKLGENVLLFGFPSPSLGESRATVGKGTVNRLVGVLNDAHHFQIDAVMQTGQCGGPLTTESGSVVGVVTTRLGVHFVRLLTGHSGAVNYVLQGKDALSFLQKYPDVVGQLKVADNHSDGSIERAVESVVNATVQVESCW